MKHGKPLTPIETKLYAMLQDGHPHKHTELMVVIDSLATQPELKTHISRLRRKLPAGYDIVSVRRYWASYYQLVRTVGSANSGRT